MTNLTSFKSAAIEDIQVETFLAELEGAEENLYQYFILPVGAFSRSYGKDMVQYHNEDDNPQGVNRKVVEVNRNGVYDSCPEGMWHPSTPGKSGMSVTGMKLLVQKNREISFRARRFLWPLDNEFIYARARIRLFERSSILGIGNTRMKNPLNRFWRPNTVLNTRQRILMVLLCPMMHKIASKSEWIESTIGLFIGNPIHFSRRDKALRIKGNIQAALDSCYLGMSTVLGSSFECTEPVGVLTLLNISGDRMKDFLPGKTMRIALEYICSFLFPCDLELEYYFKPENEFSTLNDPDTGLLGYNVILN